MPTLESTRFAASLEAATCALHRYGSAMSVRALCVLALLVLACFPAHASFGDCADPAYLDRFDERLNGTGYDCIERLRIPVRTGDGERHIRLIHDLNADWILEESQLREFERGVRAAAAALTGIGRYSIADVSVLIADDFPPPSGAETFSNIMGMANGEARWPECHIVLYLIGPGGSRAHMASTVAHEIFHCVQAATYSPGQYGAYRRDGGAAWWIEGSAEWFASLALPDDSTYQSRIDEFDALASTTPLHRMSYSALPFFLWHAQRHGNAATMMFLGGMADRPAAAEQLRAMSASLAADEWLRFAEDYMDREIRRPHGTPLRFAPRLGDAWHWSDDRTERTRLEPFVIARHMIEIDCGNWAVQVNPARAHASRTSRATGGSWGDFPARIDTGNGDPARRLLVGFNASATPLTLQIRVDQETGCSACAGITTTDECLVGSWEETAGGSIEWLRANMPAGVLRQAETSRKVFAFHANGRFTSEPLTGSLTLQTAPDTRGEGTINNVQSSGRWSAAAGRLYLCPETQVFDARARLIANGRSVAIPLPPARPQEQSMAYACALDSLDTELEIPSPRGRRYPPMRTTFDRIR